MRSYTTSQIIKLRGIHSLLVVPVRHYFPPRFKMARIIIYNTTILTLDDNDNFYYPGTVEIEDDCITKVYDGTPGEELLNDSSVTLLDGTDKLVMPGFVDLHFHTSVAKVLSFLPCKKQADLLLGIWR